MFASTSSIYGNQKEKKFHEGLKTDKPLSFYAATKKANEVLLYTYSQLYKIPITVMRFLQSMVLGEDQIWPYLNLLNL